MPAKSAAQKRFMDAAAHSPDFAKKAGVPVSVASEFSKASKGQKFGNGTRPEQQGVNKPKTNHGKSALFAKGGSMKESKAMEFRHAAAMKKSGVPKKIVAEEMAEARGMPKKMAVGGAASMPSQANMGGAARGLERAAAMSGRAMPAVPVMPNRVALPPTAQGVPMKKGGKTACYAKGGGIEVKGKTRGKIC